MPTTIETTAATRVSMPAQKVYTKKLWRDDWTEQTGLWCKSLEFACSPSLGEAVFEFRYGHGVQPGAGGLEARANIAKLSIVGHYVKVVVDPDADPENPGQPDPDGDANEIPVWCGRIQEVLSDVAGVTASDEEGETVETGVQTFVAWDISSILDQCILDTAWVENDGSAISKDDAPELEIGRALGFNCGSESRGLGDVETPNRSLDVGQKGVYLFSKDAFNAGYGADYWKLKDALRYLLYYHGPQEGDEFPFSFFLDGDQVPDVTAKLHPHGMTLRQALDRLLDRRRACGWYVTLDNDDTIDIWPFTHCETDATLESGETIPANPNQVSLDFDTSLDIQMAQVRDSQVARYDAVIARGARITMTMTLDTTAASPDIVRDWTDAELTAYNTAASGEADYAGLNEWEKQLRNTAYRENRTGQAGQRVERVFRWFKLKDDWNGTERSGNLAMRGQRSRNLDLTANRQEDIDATKQAQFWQPGLRFLPQLPLRAGVDYRTVTAESTEAKTAEDGNYLRPLVALRLGEDSNSIDRYCLVDQAGALSQTESDWFDSNFAYVKWSASVRIRDDVAGLILDPQGPAYEIGGTDFAPIAGDDPPGVESKFDWDNWLQATVCIPLDDHCEFRAVGDSDPINLTRTLVIDVPDAHLDYLVPGTMVGLKDGLPVYSAGGVIRSDLPRLATIAKQAAAWYCQTRRMLTLQYKQIRRTCDLGELVTQIGSIGHEQDIRTVVTRIRYDFDSGTTTIQTNYAELDCKQM